MRRFIRCIGLWMPGVSKSTICPSGLFTTARMRLRVVCGLSETMATFWPTRLFTSVDLPTLGRPTTVTSPVWMAGAGVVPLRPPSPLTASASADLRRKRTRFTRLCSAETTSTMKPLKSMRSPVRGTRPNAVATRPPTVSTLSPSARGTSRACSNRSTLTRPATSTAPSGSTTIGSASRSYSSLISPTISSTMSSTVTSPAVPPYSSITTANVMRRAWNSFRSSAIFFVSGTRRAGRTSGRTGSEGGPSCSMRSRTVTTPTMSSRFSPNTGMRLYLVSRMSRREVARWWSRRAGPRCPGAASSRPSRGRWRSARRPSSSRSSSGSWTGAGGTSGTGRRHLLVRARRGGLAARPPSRSARTSGPSACA